jgi:hypothetical protein
MSLLDNKLYSIRTQVVTGQPGFRPAVTQFKQNIRAEILDNGYDFILLEDMRFYFYLIVSGTEVLEYHLELPDLEKYSGMVLVDVIHVEVTVKKGFETDLVSSPRIMWWFQSPLGLASKPAVLHDIFYRMPMEIQYYRSKGVTKSILITQYLADKVFKLGLDVRGLPSWKSRAMYRVLRLFGSANFKGHS